MEKKKIPTFVEKILKNSKDPLEYERVYYKPKMSKNILGFVLSVIFLIALIYVFRFNVNIYFILLFIGVLMIGTYYGINLFTKRGFLLPKFVPKKDENHEEVEDEVYYDDTDMFLEDEENNNDNT